jgi:FtsH-binding integral membrane protein
MRVYNTTGLSIGGALLAAALGTAMPFCAIHPVATSIGGMLASLACFIGVQFTTPNTITEYIPGTSTPIYKTQNPLHRILMYSLGIATLGISTSPLFSFILATNPSIITASLGLTMGIFGGASLMAYRLPANKVLGYGRILMGSLIGLIGIQILGVASMAIVGPNALSMLLFNVQNYLGVALFTALIGYDTHVAMAEYRSGIADHLRLSVQLVLDFWNLMVRIMSIMSMFRE